MRLSKDLMKYLMEKECSSQPIPLPPLSFSPLRQGLWDVELSSSGWLQTCGPPFSSFCDYGCVSQCPLSQDPFLKDICTVIIFTFHALFLVTVRQALDHPSSHSRSQLYSLFSGCLVWKRPVSVKDSSPLSMEKYGNNKNSTTKRLHDIYRTSLWKHSRGWAFWFLSI